MLALTTAEVGVVFCTIVLVTGPIWARPVWGIWWAPGDIRLTSTLVLWLIYVSYLVLRRFSNSAQTQMLAAALAVFGALDVPLVYFSIWFFRTQHPQPVIGGGGSMDPRMLHVLLISWMAFLCFAFLVCWSRFRLELLHREIEEGPRHGIFGRPWRRGQGQSSPQPEFVNECDQISFRRIHCHVGHPRGLSWHPGAEIQPAAAAVEGSESFQFPAFASRVSAQELKFTRMDVSRGMACRLNESPMPLFSS